MTDRSGEKVSRLSDQSFESIESYHEPTQTLQLRSLCQEDEGGDANQSRSLSRDCNVLLTDSELEGTAQETTGQDVVIQRAFNVDEVTGPFLVTYRTQEGPIETKQTASSVSSQSASSKKVVKNSTKGKRRAKSEVRFDVPAALKSLRRRPRSGFPQRQGIIARRGVCPHSWGSEEEQWTVSGGGGFGGSDDGSWQVTSDGDPQAGSNQSGGSTSPLDSCSRNSWVDESNEDTSSCSSPLDSVRQGCHEVNPHQQVPQASGVQELTDRPRSTLVDVAAEAEMRSHLQRTSVTCEEGESATPDDSRDIHSRSRSQSSNPSGQGRIRNRENMTLAMENPPAQQSTTVIGSRRRIDPCAPSEEMVSSSPNIFITSSPQNICQNILSPSRMSETLPAVFVFPDQQSHTDPRQRTASVAPAPSQPSRSAATLNSSVVTPPRQPSLSGRKGKGRGRPADYSEIPAALQSLRRKPRSGFGQRTSFMNRMQVGPQESTRVDASLAQSQSLDNSEPNLESAVPSTSGETINDNLPMSRTIQHQSQIESQDQGEPSVPRTILEAIANVTVSTRAHDQETAALRSLRRHPRSGFQRRRPRVSGHFPEASCESTPSEATGATAATTASVDEAAEVGRRSETPAEPDEQVVVSRRPALRDPDRSSPPPSYDDLFFYPVGDDIANIAEAFLPDQFSPRLPSYDDVLRLSQESPPPYMETTAADDAEPDS
ncbi:uncharacterized protein LOC135489519 [Lineus longissimus]|uniref:uncharacterized protein LOC135489519 n=1 Tax=Lineus longissimus TaxID=88925 RepID=UPI002B4DAB37